MSKFLQIVNENIPSTQNLLKELEKEGVEITKTETGYKITFNLDIANTEENEEFGTAAANKRTSEDYIDNNVSNLASQAGKISGYLGVTSTGKAKQAVNKRKGLNDQMIAAYDKITTKIGQALSQINATP